MIRTHVSETDALVLTDVEQPPGGGMWDPPHWTCGKPRGLWWEIDGNWQAFCWEDDAGKPEWVRGRFLYEVDVEAVPRLLRLATMKECVAFSRQYPMPLFPGQSEWLQGVDWQAVANEYDGIEILTREYHLFARDPFWLSGWNIRSGCVWRPAGVRLTLLGPVPEPQPPPCAA